MAFIERMAIITSSNLDYIRTLGVHSLATLLGYVLIPYRHFTSAVPLVS